MQSKAQQHMSKNEAGSADQTGSINLVCCLATGLTSNQSANDKPFIDNNWLMWSVTAILPARHN